MPHLRIAHVTEHYYPHLGGVCEHVHYLARECRRLGHQVDVITGNMPGAEPEPHVIRFGQSHPMACNGSLARVTLGRGLRDALRRILRDGRYDVVHVQAPLMPVLGLVALEEARNAGCAVVGTFHAYFDYSVAYALAPRYFRRRAELMDAAIAVSPSVIQAHRRYFDCGAWQIIPNGIDPTVFHPDVPPPPGWAGRGGGDDDRPTILFLGRFDRRNNFPTLYHAFRRVRSRRRQARVVAVGDGPLRQQWRGVAGGDPDVTFTGPVPGEHRPGYYAHSSIYACPTITGASFGITLLESMAVGTPVACSDITGFRNVVRHGREALLSPAEDAAALADSLVRLLDDPDLRARLGHAGRARALEYGWPRVAQQVLAVYDRVLGRSAAAAAAATPAAGRPAPDDAEESDAA